MAAYNHFQLHVSVRVLNYKCHIHSHLQCVGFSHYFLSFIMYPIFCCNCEFELFAIIVWLMLRIIVTCCSPIDAM